MARYIDAEKLSRDVISSWDRDTHKTIEASRIHRQEHHHLMSIIEKQPTADVVEVKHGEWIESEKEEYYESWIVNSWYKPLICSECGYKRPPLDNYKYPICQNCGADMRGDK